MRRIFHLLVRPVTILVVACLVLLWLGYHIVFKWNAEAMVTTRHAELISHFSDKKFKKCAPYFSDTYLDQWSFNKDDIMLSIRDIGGQFLILHITMEDFTVSTGDQAATSSAVLRLRGSGSAGAQIVVGEANRVKTPFVFHWRKESWRPSSWRIHRIENEGLPDFRGYRPGDFGAAMRELTP